MNNNGGGCFVFEADERFRTDKKQSFTDKVTVVNTLLAADKTT